MRSRRRLAAVVGCGLLAALVAARLAWQPATEPTGGYYTAEVERVVDGDTLVVVRRDSGDPVRIRLHGIDAPETDQPYAAEATAALGRLARGRLGIVPLELDRYGRTVAVVYSDDGANLNQALVAQGAAWWFRRYAPDDAELRRLEAEAKLARRGLWASADPVAPWDYRNPPAASPEPVELSDTTVYVTASGGKYHRAGCRYLAAGGAPMPLAEALVAGYSACSVCAAAE